jgi:hypothetical protein
MPDKAGKPVSRLGRLMESRRLDLELYWEDVATLAEVSIKALYNARLEGAPLPSPMNRRNVDRALRWQAGSMERAHGGGDPGPLPQRHKQPLEDVLDDLLERFPGNDPLRVIIREQPGKSPRLRLNEALNLLRSYKQRKASETEGRRAGSRGIQ